jgi:predicted SAM-dependent methyltransferase
MRTRKWLVLSSIVVLSVWIVISSVWTITRIWAIGGAGLLRILEREYKVFSAGTIIERYLASTGVRKLQVGAGPNNLPGWLNTDIEPRPGQAFLDATKPFPIPDNSLNYVYAEQVIEHLSFKGGMVMLRESYRTLAPGGKLRIATPDLRQLVALFDQDDTEAERRFMTAHLKMERLSVKEPERPLFIMNMYFHAWGHQFLYDKQSLQSALESVEFRDVRFLRHNESDDPELRNVERHIYLIGSDIDEYVTVIVQASK